MKNYFLFQILLCSLFFQNSFTDSVISKNLFQSHSFGSSSAREILLMKQAYVDLLDHDEWQGTLSLATEYSQNFGNSSLQTLGAMPFWSGSNIMTIGTNDGRSDVDAYQFGMGDVTELGSICLQPCIQQVGTDMLLYFAQNKFSSGLFFKLKASPGAMSIYAKSHEDPALLDSSENTSWLSYPSPKNRYKSLTEALNGGSVDLAGTLNNAGISSSVHKPIALEKGRISCCKLSSIRLADLSATLGWNLVGSEYGFWALGCKLSCPTGTVPQGKYVLEPIFGRAGHWGIGAEFSSHYTLLQCDDHSLDVWLQGEVMHVLHGRRPSWRSFDLKANGPGSKYMLLQFYYASNTSGSNPTGYVPSFITQAVNITTLPVFSSYAVEGSAACMFDYHFGNINLGFGAQVWGRSKERLEFDTCNLINQNAVNLNDYAVLGRQISEDATTLTELYYCEPLARINKSLPVQGVGGAVNQYPDRVKDARVSINRIPANLYDALDVCSAAEQRAITGMLFGQIGYTWNLYRYDPNISLYGSIELAESGKSMINTWSVGLQLALNC